MEGNFSWVSLPNTGTTITNGEYQTSDKRNRNPNWTNLEISRFLTILMEDNSLRDLNSQKTKQVFCYVSRVMCSEGSEKTWDQCKVKLKNLKYQWRYVKDRVPSIEHADMNDENVARQLMLECQANGVSPACIQNLRLLQQFLTSLDALRRGVSPPRYNDNMKYNALEDQMRLVTSSSGMKMEDYETFEESEGCMLVETDISPSPSPSLQSSGLRVMSPGYINNEGQKRKAEQEPETIQTKRLMINDSTYGIDSLKGKNVVTAAILQRFQRDTMDKFLQFQRESETRFLSWEQDRWRMEQNMLDRWRNEQRGHEKEMFLMFCNSLSQCTQTILKKTI